MAMLAALVFRAETSINVLRDRNPLYVKLSDGGIRNGYTFKVLNMVREPKSFRLSLAGIDDAEMTVIGQAKEPVRSIDLAVRADTVGTYRVFVRAPESAVHAGSQTLRFVLVDLVTGEAKEHETTFRGPER